MPVAGCSSDRFGSARVATLWFTLTAVGVHLLGIHMPPTLTLRAPSGPGTGRRTRPLHGLLRPIPPRPARSTGVRTRATPDGGGPGDRSSSQWPEERPLGGYASAPRSVASTA